MRQGRDLEEHPFMLANIDRVVVGENIGLECKTVNLYQSDKWKDDEIIQTLISIESNFWNNNVLTNIMPSPDGSKVADEVINRYFGKSNNNDILNLQGFDDMLKRRDELNSLLEKLEQE